MVWGTAQEFLRAFILHLLSIGDIQQGGGSAKETVERIVSTTDPDCGMFIKGEHERQFAYKAHTACDRNGIVLGVEVTAGNVHDTVAFDSLKKDALLRVLFVRLSKNSFGAFRRRGCSPPLRALAARLRRPPRTLVG